MVIEVLNMQSSDVELRQLVLKRGAMSAYPRIQELVSTVSI